MSLKTLTAVALAVAIPTLASAIPITAGSQLNVNGFTVGVGSTGTIASSTGLDFTSAAAPTTPTPGVAGDLTGTSGTSTFASLACAGLCGSIQDILNFASFAPINAFYTTLSGVTFDLNTLDPPVAVNAGASALILSGTGTFHYTGYDPTPGVFSLTTQGGQATTFSASTIGQAVNTPEPASMALLGMGLIGLGLVGRFRRG